MSEAQAFACMSRTETLAHMSWTEALALRFPESMLVASSGDLTVASPSCLTA
jgi:hypothetical protein